VLTLLCTVAAGAAVWLSLAVEQLGRGVAGLAAGVPLRGFELSGASAYTVHAVQGSTERLGPGGWAFMVLAGPVLVVMLALLLFAVVSFGRSRGWLKGFSLAWLVVALLWLPTAMVAAALPAALAGWPVAELYHELGTPQAGRWAAGALGLLALVLVSGFIVARAVAIGRAWMRADAVEFRRRLVRVTAGWPGIAGVAALSCGAGWAPTAWIALYLAAVGLSFHIRTR